MVTEQTATKKGQKNQNPSTIALYTFQVAQFVVGILV